MRRFAILLGVVVVTLVAASCVRSSAQPLGAKEPKPQGDFVGVEAPSFPRDWVGSWTGRLYITSGRDQTGSRAVRLEIKPLPRPDGTLPPSVGGNTEARDGDRYLWTTTISGVKTPDTPIECRSETLIVVNADTGRFEVRNDAGQSIRVDDLSGPIYSERTEGGVQTVTRSAMRWAGGKQPRRLLEIEELVLGQGGPSLRFTNLSTR
ncbi:MAG: hypothetical protein ACKVW3_08470 [Phycisphaerales bacterium]